MTQYRVLEKNEPLKKGDMWINYFGNLVPCMGEKERNTLIYFRPIEGWIKFSDRKPDKFPCVVSYTNEQKEIHYNVFQREPANHPNYVSWLPFDPATAPESDDDRAFKLWDEAFSKGTDRRELWESALNHARKPNV